MTVRRAVKTAPAAEPSLPSRPLGRSTASTGAEWAVQAAAGSVSWPRNPAPNRPSISRSQGSGAPRGRTGTPAAAAAAAALPAGELPFGRPRARTSTATPRRRR